MSIYYVVIIFVALLFVRCYIDYRKKSKLKKQHFLQNMTISKDGRMNSIKTIVIIISLFVFLIAPANAVVSLKTKDGKILRWKNYTEEGSDYCTMSSAGKFCIPKNSVISISGENEGYAQESAEEIEKRKKEKEQYLKEKEKEQMEWKIKENLTKIKEKERNKAETRNACLNNASQQSQQEWDAHCTKKGLNSGCSLPATVVLIFDQRFRDRKEECHRFFKN
ncbi:MAG: hypothetical protein Q8M34_10650 [Thermodesulfovibrionales bacterium]|nr:hypothetical protein [Thermodesulfovibrionales bacterium]